MRSPRESAVGQPALLELVRESKIGDLLVDRRDKRYEASGVHFHDGYLYVVFDDSPDILRMRPDWTTGQEAPALIETHVRAAGGRLMRGPAGAPF